MADSDKHLAPSFYLDVAAHIRDEKPRHAVLRRGVLGVVGADQYSSPTWYGPSLDLKRPTNTRPPIWLGLMMRVLVLRLLPLLTARWRRCLPATTAARADIPAGMSTGTAGVLQQMMGMCICVLVVTAEEQEMIRCKWPQHARRLQAAVGTNEKHTKSSVVAQQQQQRTNHGGCVGACLQHHTAPEGAILCEPQHRLLLPAISTGHRRKRPLIFIGCSSTRHPLALEGPSWGGRLVHTASFRLPFC